MHGWVGMMQMGRSTPLSSNILIFLSRFILIYLFVIMSFNLNVGLDLESMFSFIDEMEY